MVWRLLGVTSPLLRHSTGSQGRGRFTDHTMMSYNDTRHHRSVEAGDCYYLVLDDRQRTEALVDSLVERLQV